MPEPGPTRCRFGGIGRAADIWNPASRPVSLSAVSIAVLLGLGTTLAHAANWYTLNGTKGECERASRTDFPTPDDFSDYLHQQNRYRSKQVTRDFTGRTQVVSITDIDNRQTVFFIDEAACQQALRRAGDRRRFGDPGQVR
jgi:hypothetical protein